MKTRKPTQCAVKICKRPVHARGLCQPHYQQLRTFGKITHDKIRAMNKTPWRPDDAG